MLTQLLIKNIKVLERTLQAELVNICIEKRTKELAN